MDEMEKQLHEARHRDRVRTGGAVCPKCGVKWDDERFTISPIRGTYRKGFFKKYPGYWCMECGYQWDFRRGWRKSSSNGKNKAGN